MRRGVVLGSSVFFSSHLTRLELKNRLEKKKTTLLLRTLDAYFPSAICPVAPGCSSPCSPGGALDRALEWTHNRLLFRGNSAKEQLNLDRRRSSWTPTATTLRRRRPRLRPGP